MNGRLKRTMKLMWGHSEKVRYTCGCSLALVSVFVILAYVSEWSFFHGRNSAYRIGRIDSFSIGNFACMCFLFYSMYSNGKLILSGMGKWLCGSKLAKYVLIKGVIINRLILFSIVFVPCLLSRVRLIGLGYTEYARMELFLISWGAVYLFSAVSCISEAAFLAGFALYMSSMFVGKFWLFATWIRLPAWGVALIFLGCLVVGTFLEKLILETGFKKRKAGKVAVLQIGWEGNKQNG